MTFRQLVADNLEDIAFFVSFLAAGTGLVALLLVRYGWQWLGPRYREYWAKWAVGGFRLLAALSAVAAKTAPSVPDASFFQQPWSLTILLAASGYFLWELAGPYGDHRHKQSKEKTAAEHQQEIETLTQDRDDAEFQTIRLGRMMTHLREMVSKKTQRIRNELGERAAETRPSIQQVRDALAPDEHLEIILESLAGLLRLDAVSEGRDHYHQNFRIGLYVSDTAGVLRPYAAFDLATKSHTPFNSHEEHTDRFRLDSTTRPSHAVRCVLEGRLLIVEDCATNPEFAYFDEKQKQYLSSLIACPLTNFSMDGKTVTRAALLIDTNETGFFREEDREMIEMLVKEFVVRVDLEYAIKRLLG